MGRQYDRRTAHTRAATLMLASAGDARVQELYQLFMALEHEYLDTIERAVRAEVKLTEIAGLAERWARHGCAKTDERQPARRDIWDREGGEAGQ